MALKAKNNIDLVINSTVDGLESIAALARDLDKLGVEGEQARDELLGLTSQLQKLATQAQLVESFRRQKTEVTELSSAYEKAKAKSTELGRVLAQTETPTKKQTDAFRQARTAASQLEERYKAAAADLQRLRNELSATGVNLRALGSEYARISRESRTVEAALQKLAANASKLAAARPVQDITKPLRDGAERTNRVVSNLPKLLSAITATVGLNQVVRAFADAAKSGETFDRALNIITGSTEAAADAQLRLIDFAERYGISVQTLERAYINFNAAVQGTNFEGERGQKIFESFAGALGLLGKSNEDIEGALLAVNQIISKNTVSSEELRQQLAERLPGAYRLAAESIGLTTAQLSKQLELGKITADQLLPRLAARLRATYNLDTVERIEGIAAAQGRLATATTEFWRALANTGAGRAFASVIEGAASLLNGFTAQIKSATDELPEFARNSVATAADLDTLSGSAKNTSAAVDELNQKLREQAALNLERQQAEAAAQIDKFAVAAGQAARELDNMRARGLENTEAFRLQNGVFQGANSNLIDATRRYHLLAREIAETLNPALREQRLAQEAANKAAREAADAQDESAAGLAETIKNIEQLNEALGRAGIKSQAELEAAADAARGLFEATKATGAATADQRRAFEDYAKKARAAAEFATAAEQRTLELRLKLAEATIKLGISTENAGKKKVATPQDVAELERLLQAGQITQETFDKLSKTPAPEALKSGIDAAADSAENLQKKAEIKFSADASETEKTIAAIDRSLTKLSKGVTIPVRLKATGEASLLRQLEQSNLGLS